LAIVLLDQALHAHDQHVLVCRCLEHDEHGARLLRIEPRLELGDPLDQ